MKRDRLVHLFEAQTLDEAELLAERLDRAGIESFVESVDSPAEGLIAGRDHKIILVYPPDLEQARQIVKVFLAEGHQSEGGEAGMQQEGMELPSTQRPSEESPSADVEGAGVERMDMDRPGAPAPETDDMLVDDDPRREQSIGEDRIRSFGTDRDVTEGPIDEDEEFQDTPIDELDVNSLIDDPELGTPSANLRPGQVEDADEEEDERHR